MRVLLLPLGSHGDINPFIGLGLALQERGHEAVVIANSYFESIIKQVGLGFASSAPAQAYLDMVHNPDMGHPKRGPALHVARLLAVMPKAFSMIKQLLQPGNTIIAAPSLAFAARIAQETMGVPMATVGPNPLMLRSTHAVGAASNDLRSRVSARWKSIRLPLMHRIFRKPIIEDLITPEVNSFRAKFGLKPVPSIWGSWTQSPQRVIGLWPEWFYGPQPDWPPQAVVTGFIEYDAPARVEAPHLIPESDFGGKLPIVFTAGTACFDAPDFFAAACEACETLNSPGILLTQQENPVLKPLPRMVRHIRFAPLGEILAHAAAIVHRGGIGTAARALKAGIPQIILPIGFDGFNNAHCLMRLGVANSIERRHVTGYNVAAALRELLQSQTVSDRCRQYAKNFEHSTALESTCDYIEALN
jgi:rhamnosyltransferase subunit B